MSLPPPRRPLKSRSLRHHRRQAPAGHPAVVEDDLPSIGKLLRPLLKLLLVAAVLGGFIWFYFRGLKEMANTTVNVNNGLRAVAAELWNSGAAVEIPDMDPDITRLVTKLKLELQGRRPSVVVTDDGLGSIGSEQSTHQILYTVGQQMVLSLLVAYTPVESKIEILSYELGPDYQDLMKSLPAKKAPTSGEPEDSGKPQELKGL